MPAIETKGSLSSQGFGEFTAPGKEPVFVEDVFSTTLYSASSAYTSASVPALTNPVLSPASVDPDWQYVKRYLPLIDSNSYDAATNTHLGGNLTGGSGLPNPFGGFGVVSYAANDTTDYSSYYSPISGANYNGPWCIEAWVYVERLTTGSAKVYIHDEGSLQNSIILAATGTTGGSSGQLQAFVRRNDINVMAQYITIPGAQWVFVSLSYDGSTLKVHANDQLKYSVAFTGWTTQPNNNIRMGCQTSFVDDTVTAAFCQYRATFGSARTSTRGIPPSRPFPITGQKANCNNALLWFKRRSNPSNHYLQTVDQGYVLSSNLTSTYPGTPSYGGGITVGTGVTNTGVNIFSSGSVNDTLNERYALWSFTAAPKFLDIVEYTGTGTARTVNHNLDATPGMIIIKNLTLGVAWAVYHTSVGATKYLALNTTDAAITSSTYWNNTSPTSTNFTVGTADQVNRSGNKYIAYVFANNSGGFGLSGTENVITCGSFTADGSGNATVNLGWEPQWILCKNSLATASWEIVDNMRGMEVDITSTAQPVLEPNFNSAEFAMGSQSRQLKPTPTGFVARQMSNNTFVYVAIRRGPMKKPTDATKVFSSITYDGTSTANTTRTTGIVTDMLWSRARSVTNNQATYDRLRGAAKRIETTTSNAETAEVGDAIGLWGFDSTTGYKAGADQGAGSINLSGRTYINWAFRRAPGFFDIVGYTGTGAARTVNHSLGVVPELIITKNRSAANTYWATYCAALGATKGIFLNTNLAASTNTAFWNNTEPTASAFTLAATNGSNFSGHNAVAYLFATCPGVSKVGSYTGTGTTQQINCGFTTGARFVMIKQTDTTGDWYVWDSARGIVTGNDPYLLMNSTAAEDTTTDYIDTYSAGFEISSTAPTAINASGGSYIYLAIA